MKMYQIAVVALALSSNAYADAFESGGMIEFGAAGYRTTENGDGNNPGNRVGMYGAAQATVPFGESSRFVMDLQSERFAGKNSTEYSDFGSHRATLASFGLHTKLKGGLGGPFIGYAQPDVDGGHSSGRTGGYMAGIQYISDGSTQGFVTLGHADIVSDFSSGASDGQFRGPFADAGVVGTLGTNGAFKLHAGYGHTSKAFDNSGVYAPASYGNVGAKFLYAINQTFHVVAGLEFTKHKSGETTQDYSNRASDTRYTLGIVIPFGKQSITTASLRPLAPTLAPVRAAGWNEVLDNSAPSKN